jgi:hypothetical protein
VFGLHFFFLKPLISLKWADKINLPDLVGSYAVEE